MAAIWTGSTSTTSAVVRGRFAHRFAVREGGHTEPAGSSHFTAAGCGFRPSSSDYTLVTVGPAPDTASLAYWVDPFPVDASGCGSATVGWASSGVAGSFEVYVARSPSDNFWRAQPASNVVVVVVASP